MLPLRSTRLRTDSARCGALIINSGVMVLSKFRLMCEDGNALAEFVLVFPLFLIIIFGIIELALLFTDKMVLHYATYAGLRSGVVDAKPDERIPRTTKLIMCDLRGPKEALPILGGLNFSVDVSQEGDNLCVETDYLLPRRLIKLGNVLGIYKLGSSCQFKMEK